MKLQVCFFFQCLCAILPFVFIFSNVCICISAGTVEVVCDNAEYDYGEPSNQPSTSQARPSTSQAPPSKPKPIYTPASEFVPKWKKTKRCTFDIEPIHAPLGQIQDEMFDKIRGLTPMQLFELFFDETVIDMLVTETNRYGTQHNIHLVCDKYLIRRFIGILILSGYLTLPEIKCYWSMQPTFGIPIVRQSMPRNTFTRIKSNFVKRYSYILYCVIHFINIIYNEKNLKTITKKPKT